MAARGFFSPGPSRPIIPPPGSAPPAPTNRIPQAIQMTQSENTPDERDRAGLMEYCILALVIVVVTVTAWTLVDNGLLDTLTSQLK